MYPIIVDFLAGLIAPFVVNEVRKRLEANSVLALWILYFISLCFAICISLITNKFDVTNVLASVAIISSTAQTIFHAFLKYDKKAS